MICDGGNTCIGATLYQERSRRIEAPPFTAGSLICSASVAFRPPLTKSEDPVLCGNPYRPSVDPALADGCAFPMLAAPIRRT